MLVGQPFLRMTAFHVLEGVLTIVAMVLPVQCSRFRTVPKVYRRPKYGARLRKALRGKFLTVNHKLFILFILNETNLVGLQGFEPRTKGL